MNELIYISVCYDRHVDDEIIVHRTKEGAKAKCDKFMSGYTRYGEPFIPNEFAPDDTWVYMLEFEMDEAPYAYVKRVGLID